MYNGVDPSNFAGPCDDDVRAKWAAPDEKIVLYVGRFVREKGIGVLLGSMSAVLAQEPKARFVVVGGGSDRPKFEGFARWSGLEDRVTFAGFISGEPLHELYRIADVAVFPSLYEPFGIVALEAMAAGVPVVASDAGGLKEIVVHDATGTSTFAGDSSSLAWGIRRVLGDPVRAKRLAASASARLAVEFDWGRLADRTAALYARVWDEFLHSYWAERTVWPVSPGAEARYEELRLRERLEAARVPERQMGAEFERPRSRVSVPEREGSTDATELFDTLIRPSVEAEA
ncbi:glycosyltransferase family 1 protein [bacterium]|nr:MAG: glycosyltransferase family 1 protein [bacterium]